MIEDADYFPNDEEGQRRLLLSLKTKLENYETELQLTAADITGAVTRSELFDYLINQAALLEDGKTAFNKAKEIIIDGKIGEPVPTFPKIELPVPPTLTVGIIKQTRKLVRRIKEAEGYTDAIGKDLGIVKPDADGGSAENIVPALANRGVAGFGIETSFLKRGMDGLRLEYRHKGGSWQLATIALSSPVIYNITPQTPGFAEQLEIRAIYMKKNATFGQYSPSYTVVIAP
jgi:hypothetical protein